MGVVAPPHPENEGDGGTDRPSVCSELLGKFSVLCFLAFQGLFEAGIATEPDFEDSEGRERAKFPGPVWLVAVEQGSIVVDDKNVRPEFVSDGGGEVGEHPCRNTIADVVRETGTALPCVNQEVGIGDVGGGGF